MADTEHENPARAFAPVFPGADKRPAAKRNVAEIEGVTDYDARNLQDLGITNIGDLWRADPLKVADELGVPEETVRDWRSMGELIDVRGVGPQFADLLVRCGVRSVTELADQDPQELMAHLLSTEGERERRLQGTPLGLATVENWVKAARQYVSEYAR